MTSVVTTLFEAGPYEEGAAALLNSLVAAGFEGRVYCGIRGAVPKWLAPEEVRRCVGESIEIRAVSPATSRHLTLYKADFLRLVADQEPDAASIVYFDPDLVVKCEWSFVERWAASGIAAVADIKPTMPRSSPIRHDWLALCVTLGVSFEQSSTALDTYCNAGFVGVNRACLGFLELWSALIDAVLAANPDGAPPIVRRPAGAGRDQDLFNIALMGWGEQVSLMGREAMDFEAGGGVFSHATGRRLKPWNGRFVRSALVGRPPGRGERWYLHYRGGPFDPPGRWKMGMRRASYRAGRAIGTVIKRPEN